MSFIQIFVYNFMEVYFVVEYGYIQHLQINDAFDTFSLFDSLFQPKLTKSYQAY